MKPNPDKLDFNLRVRAGKEAGVATASGTGHSDVVGTTLGLLYHKHDTAAVDAHVFALVATPATVQVASTSGVDVGTVVQLRGVTGTGAAATELVVLNGQTPVAGTVVWRVVEKATVMVAANGTSNAGTVWVGTAAATFIAGVPTQALNAIEAGTNMSAAAIIAVPTGSVFVVTQFSIYSGDTNKVLDFEFYQYDPTTGLWYEAFDIHGTQSGITPDVYSYPALQPGAVVMLRASVNVGHAIATGVIGGYMVGIDD